MVHLEAKHGYRFDLTDAVTSSDGLIFYCRIPVGANKVYFTKVVL